MRQHMMDQSRVSVRTSMFRTSTTGLVVLATLATLVSFACCDSTSSASLSAYHPLEYIYPEEGNEFSHFAKDPKTGNFYIGANKALLQLGADLNQQRIVSTAPDPETCQIPCNNQNRILIVAPDPIDRLITCDDYSKTCQLRNLSNISSAERYPNVVINSGSSAAGVLTRGESPYLYVGVGPNFLINQVEKIPYVTRWELQPPFSSSSMTTQQSPEAAQLKFQVHFLDGFSYEGFTYFVTTQQQLQGGSHPDDAPYVSALNRVCQSPTTSLDSFTELPITCSSGDGGISYNLIQAVAFSVPGAHLADSFSSSGRALLYAVFIAEKVPEGVDEPQSALCIYRMSDIQEKFLDAVFECLTEQTPPISHLPGSCFNFQFTREKARNVQCEEDPFYNYAAAQEPLPAEAVLQLDGVHATSISIATEEKETVAFIGTETGDLLKAHLENSSYARKYEAVTVGSTPVKQVTLFNSSNDQLYVLTEQKLVRMSTVNCSQYTTCTECIGENGADDGDPYCGWCTLEARCTRYRDCMQMEEPSRWLPFSSEECVGIEDTSVGLSLPVSSPSQTINVTVNQLPALRENYRYKCLFGEEIFPAIAVVGSQVTCETPSGSQIPDIAPGESAVTVALSIFSTETRISFVERDFKFYNCRLISSCSSCMNSSWACHWCIYGNECTHDNSTCPDGDDSISSSETGALEKCPYIDTPDEDLLLPVGVEKSFTLKARNLAQDRKWVSGYQCVLEIEGRAEPTHATFPDSDTVECQGKAFSYNAVVPDMPVRMYVQWNGKNVVDDDGLEITLYNCSVDRDSCSRCLSPQRSPPELNCQWCGNICAFGGSPVCTAVDPVMQNTSTVCGNPKILDLKPRSGPLEGNTLVMITGTDFGQEFSDITSVTIGDLPCSLEGMMEFYDPGRSVSCKTSAGNEESARAKISVTSNGRTLQGTGGPTFSYVNPTISDFNPKIGPLAGGTKVIITGTHLDTGSEITATFGNTSCVFEGDKTNEKATCRTTEGESLVRVPLTIYFDGARRDSKELFTFQSNPVITSLSTEKTIVAGGTRIMVTGTGFDAIQSASLVVSMVGGDGENYSLRGPCYPNNSTTITCTSPAIPTAGLYNMVQGSRRRRATEVSEVARGTMTLILDGFNITLDNELVYYRNPVYDAFKDGVVDFAETIVINGKYLNAASTKEDVVVEVGVDNGTILSLGPEVLLFTPPPKQPQLRTDNNSTKNMPLVVVRHGTSHVIGYIDYSKVKDNSMMTMIIIISAIGGTIVIIVLIFICLYFTSKRNFKKELARVEIAMAEMEDTFKNEATKAFIDIQQDMTGIKDQLKDLGGMPFVSSQDYVRNMLFVGQGMQPLTVDPQLPEENLKKAMTDFSKLLNNKDFLLVFIRSLDEDKKLQMKERQNIASLLTVVLVLEGKLSYLTEVMLTLMLEEITTAADTERYRQLFKRTETIVEKMLANWMALCMYSYLQKHVAYPLYLLYQAIKFQVEKGPVDVITGHAHYSLNYEYLLDEDVNFHEVNLQVENRLQEMENNMVKVLSVDTITQVKTKILDAVFRNKPLSARYITMDVDLVLRSGKMGQLVLRDTDNTTEKPDVNRWAKVNTISHYAISDGATVSLVSKQINPNASLATPLDEDTELLAPSPLPSPKRGPPTTNTNVESDLEEGFQFYHLSPLFEDDAFKKNKKGLRNSSNTGPRIKHRKIREIYLRRLVSTKKSVQTFVDDVLAVMLSVSDDRPFPKALKYLFDFFDRQADKHKLKGAADMWKNSCLPLRFWVTAMTHPAYVFDMHQTDTIDASVSVLTQMLDNACKGIVPKYSIETSPSRVLYANELPKYIEMIQTFYTDIRNSSRVNQDVLDMEFKEVCEIFQNSFSHIGTLHQLYQHASQRSDKLVEALEEDEQCQRANMGYKLEQVGTILAEGED